MTKLEIYTSDRFNGVFMRKLKNYELHEKVSFNQGLNLIIGEVIKINARSRIIIVQTQTTTVVMPIPWGHENETAQSVFLRSKVI